MSAALYALEDAARHVLGHDLPVLAFTPEQIHQVRAALVAADLRQYGADGCRLPQSHRGLARAVLLQLFYMDAAEAMLERQGSTPALARAA